MANPQLSLPNDYPGKEKNEWAFFLQNLTNYIQNNQTNISLVGTNIQSVSGTLLQLISGNSDDINALEITVDGHTISIFNLNSSINSLSNDLVSVSGNLQYQIDNLDCVTYSLLNGVSGILQENIDELYTELVNISGSIIEYVDNEFEELSNIYTPLTATEAIRISTDAKINTINTSISGINGGLSQLDNRYVNISGDTMTGLLTLTPSTSGYASLHIPIGTIPDTTVDGDIWNDSRGIFYRNNSHIHQLDYDTNTVGVTSKTTITVGVSGTTISASSVDAFLYSELNWTGDYSKFTVPSISGLGLVDNSVNYLLVEYNDGNPIFATTTNPVLINGSNNVLAATIWREGTEVHWIAVDWGLSTANRLNDRQINTQRYERSSGLMLSVSGSNIELTSGIIWYGVTANSKLAVSSSPNNCYFYYHTSSSTWTKDLVSNWNNSYYDDGSARQTLGNNNYVVNWVYRFVNGDNLPALAYILSTEYSNISNAKASTIPSSIPPILQRMGILVGRIITKKGTSTAIQTDSAFTSIFAGTTSTDHNNLSNLQGGAVGEYYHHTATQYNDFIGRTEVSSISGTLYSLIQNTSASNHSELVSVSGNLQTQITTIDNILPNSYTDKQILFSNSTGITGSPSFLWDDTNKILDIKGSGSECLSIGTLTKSVGTSNTVVGYGAGQSLGTTSTYNVFLGSSAGKGCISGNGNFLCGYESGRNFIAGSYNLGFGFRSLNSNTVGNYNIAIGQLALGAYTGSDGVAMGFQNSLNTTEGSNISIGREACRGMTTGNDNVTIGWRSLYSSNPTYCVAIGTYSLATNNGNQNIGIGRYSGYTGDGANSIYIGYESGYSPSGSGIVSIGYRALRNANTSTNTTAIGSEAGYSALNVGSNNILLGYQTGYNNAGSNNLLLGYQSGYNNTGSGNVLIGYQSGYSNTESNVLYIDNSNSATPLIKGDFTNDTLTINGTFFVRNNFSISGTNNNITTISSITAEDIHINCGTDKTIVLDTVVWDDLPPVPIIGAKPGSSAPTLTTLVGNIEQYTFDATNDYVIGSTELIHRYKEGTPVEAHIHWATNGIDVTNCGVKWRLDYSVANGNDSGAFSSEKTIYTDTAIPSGTADRKHLISNFTSDISGGSGLKIGAYICWKLSRVASISAAPSNDPFGIALGFHFQQDTMGSRTIYTK